MPTEKPKKERTSSGIVRKKKISNTEKRAQPSLGATAYERLRQAIQAGEYGPGDRLSLIHISEPTRPY